MKKIILISGKARHGKDITAEIMKNELSAAGNRVLVTHYADLVKYICRTFFDWDGNKDEKGRTLLQYVGTDIVREKDSDYWVRFVAEMLGFFGNNWDFVLIPDCRFPNEIEFMKAAHDAVHLRVRRENADNILTSVQQNHPSETALDDCEPDFWIHNNGTKEELKTAVNEWIKENL